MSEIDPDPATRGPGRHQYTEPFTLDTWQQATGAAVPAPRTAEKWPTIIDCVFGDEVRPAGWGTWVTVSVVESLAAPELVLVRWCTDPGFPAPPEPRTYFHRTERVEKR
jgi:hypothetical protein